MKKTSNKGFSMVELIIVIAIMAILAAALAPALIKYINKSRLSTDIQTGQTIATSIQSALADEDANEACNLSAGSTVAVNSILANPGNYGQAFGDEFKAIMGVTSVNGKSAKDAANSAFASGSKQFFVEVDPASNKVNVWYGVCDPNHLVAPTQGSSMTK